VSSASQWVEEMWKAKNTSHIPTTPTTTTPARCTRRQNKTEKRPDRTPGCGDKAALVAAVVVMVSVAVPAEVPVMTTGAVEPKLNVGGYWALARLEVNAAVNATLPVNPPAGVTVIVEVFPVVAPGARVTVVAETANVGLDATVSAPATATASELPATFN
jgi:hypothetical protein